MHLCLLMNVVEHDEVSCMRIHSLLRNYLNVVKDDYIHSNNPHVLYITNIE